MIQDIQANMEKNGKQRAELLYKQEWIFELQKIINQPLFKEIATVQNNLFNR